MALAATEVWQRGFVIDLPSGGPAMTTNQAGAVWSEGFLRDPDGRLVVRYA